MAVVGLVHGIGGTAATMEPLAAALAALGHDVQTVTLPGHGTAEQDLMAVQWADWLGAVPACEVLVGQSMGASLALAAAADPDRSVRAVVAINPPYADEDSLEGLEWQRSRGHEWADGAPLAEGEAGYARLPLAALEQMVRGVIGTDLTRVTCPVLLVTGALDDSADPYLMDLLAAPIAGPVSRLELANSGHVVTMGPDVAALADGIDRFLT